MHCRKCGSGTFVKNGFMAGVQRYKCKNCGFQFTRETAHGKPEKDKFLAMILYLSGLSLATIGNIVGVRAQSVMRWARLLRDGFRCEKSSSTMPEEFNTSDIAPYLDEHIRSVSGKVLIITLEHLSAGNVVIIVPKP